MSRPTPTPGPARKPGEWFVREIYVGRHPTWQVRCALPGDDEGRLVSTYLAESDARRIASAVNDRAELVAALADLIDEYRGEASGERPSMRRARSLLSRLRGGGA